MAEERAAIAAEDEAVQLMVREWLAGRAAMGRDRFNWRVLRTDGFSVFRSNSDCVATWVGGPRLHDPDVVLISDQHKSIGTLAQRAQIALRNAVEERAVPYVLVRPPYPTGIYRIEPHALVHGWEHSQAVAHMLQTGELRQAAKDLVWAWIHGEPARFGRSWCRAHITAGSIMLNEATVLTWAPRVRVALLSKRRYALNSFRRIMRDAIRVALASHDVPVRELAPSCPHAYVEPEMLVGAWEKEGWQVS
jgi:hypothetical protein